MTSRQKDWAWFATFWLLFTIIGEYLAFGVDLLPGKFSRESGVSDDAYLILVRLAVPVFAGVSAALLTVMVRFALFRHSDEPPTEDGPHVATHKNLVIGWVGVSAALALGLTINPGFVGLHDIRGSNTADMVIGVKAQRWFWTFTYPNGATVSSNTAGTEFVLPVDKRIRFDITSGDVIHSFWIPSFRMRLDALPGRTTQIYITPDRIGDGATEFNLRVQCSQLCGLGHAAMAIPVKVVAQPDFDAFVNSLAKGS